MSDKNSLPGEPGNEARVQFAFRESLGTRQTISMFAFRSWGGEPGNELDFWLRAPSRRSFPDQVVASRPVAVVYVIMALLTAVSNTVYKIQLHIVIVAPINYVLIPLLGS